MGAQPKWLFGGESVEGRLDPGRGQHGDAVSGGDDNQLGDRAQDQDFGKQPITDGLQGGLDGLGIEQLFRTASGALNQ